jgi:hypothetical protein
MEELIEIFQSRKDKADEENKYLNLAKEIVEEINSKCNLDLEVILTNKSLKFESENLTLKLEITFSIISNHMAQNNEDIKLAIIDSIKSKL